jgi:hypothetical protein
MAYWQDYLFGANPESGSWEDIAQSFLNPVYDPEGRLLGRILKEAPPPNMAEIGQNLQKDPMGDPNKAPPNPVVRDRAKEEANRTAWTPSSSTIPQPDMIIMPEYTVPEREVGRIGGEPNMYGNLQNEITEEEELAMLAQLLRRRA